MPAYWSVWQVVTVFTRQLTFNFVPLLKQSNMVNVYSCLLALACVQSVWCAPPRAHSKPFEHVKRQANSTSSSGLQVDLGYEIYEGYHNSTANINYWKGIRFAAPPLGDLRWQAPHPPTINRSSILDASEYGTISVGKVVI